MVGEVSSSRLISVAVDGPALLLLGDTGEEGEVDVEGGTIFAWLEEEGSSAASEGTAMVTDLLDLGMRDEVCVEGGLVEGVGD